MWGPWANGDFGKAVEARYKANKNVKNYETATAATFVPSPASKAYRHDMGAYLTAMRKHIEKQAYGNAIIGYKLMWGYDTQWSWPDGARKVEDEYIDGKFKRTYYRRERLDYSSAMLKYFRDFLKKKYKSIKALRSAWNDKLVTFKNATIPSVSQRRPQTTKAPRLSKYIYENMKKMRKVTDFNKCYSDVIGSLLNDMGAAIKKAGSRRILVGAYFFRGKKRYGSGFGCGATIY